jgi:hypothetical protein
MTTVSSNPIRFTINVPSAGAQPAPAVPVRRVFTGTHYNHGGKADEPPCSILAYSGCAYDPASGRIFLFGGGHHDYSGNEVWEFSVDRPQDRWTRHYAPSSYPTKAAVIADIDNAARPGMYVSTRRPIARHTYYSMTWAGNVRRMFAGGASTWDGPDGTYWSIYPNSPGDLWAYDPSQRTWEHHGSSLVNRQWPVVGAMVFHAGRGTIFAVSGRRTARYTPADVSYAYTDSPRTVWEYDPAANTWRDHGVPLVGDLQYSLIAIDSSRDRLVLVGWDSGRAMQVHVYDLAAKSWSRKSTGGSLPPAPFFSTGPREGDALAYSTATQRLLFVSATNDGSLHALDMNTWNWSVLAPTGAFPQIEQAFATAWCPVRSELYVVYVQVKALSVNVVGVKV